MKQLLTLVFAFSLLQEKGLAQNFALVTDSTNPIAAEPDCGTENSWPNNCFQGAAWVDVNSDYRLDLFYAGKLFINQGNGNFSKGQGVDLTSFNTQSSSVSFMDFDNDGYKDLLFYNGGGFGTKVFRGDGSGNLSPFATVLDSINSTVWSAQWCDYNLDSHADIILTFADGFAGNTHFPNRLFRGSANRQFTQVQDTAEFLNDLHPYTVSYWIDYDEDGDQDLFIASGPASSTGPDYLYQNLIKETGQEAFKKITQLSFASTAQNGQCYNFIDFDNDRDLDACLTNWRIVPNRFYENINGTYTSQSTPFTSSANGFHLTNAWGDIDNDGDLDVLITSTNEADAKYYFNNGDGTFSSGGNIGSLVNGPTSGLSIGDYNNDGFLDFFVTGGVKGLFKNIANNGNNFITLSLVGNPNQKSPIGARIEILATINGQQVWQKREVSSQNTFMGHNSQRVHFGLGKATNVDSLIVYWPSGSVDRHQHITPGHLYVVEEGQQPVAPILPPVSIGELQLAKNTFTVFPNPTSDTFEIHLNKPIKKDSYIILYAPNGKEVLRKTIKESNRATLDVKGLPKATYVIEMVMPEGTFRQTVSIR